MNLEMVRKRFYMAEVLCVCVFKDMVECAAHKKNAASVSVNACHDFT